MKRMGAVVLGHIIYLHKAWYQLEAPNSHAEARKTSIKNIQYPCMLVVGSSICDRKDARKSA